MIIEHAKFSIHPGQESDFEDAYLSVHRTLLRAPECRFAHLHRSVEQEGVYLLQVGWDSVAHHTEQFPLTEQGKHVISTFAPFLAAADVTHFEAETVCQVRPPGNEPHEIKETHEPASG